MTGTAIDAVCFPEVPVIVTLYPPSAAVLEAVSVRVLLLVEGLGEKEAVTPLGSPDIAN